jgi:hypothetical protein
MRVVKSDFAAIPAEGNNDTLTMPFLYLSENDL